MAITQLTIAGITIKTDSEGRYCLNDFHKAAGGELRHQPAFFLKRPESIELVQELVNENSSGQKNIAPVQAKAGRNGGTFVARELVFAYAMWISPAFHLKVIRTFDELHTKGMVMTPAVAQQAVESPETYLPSDCMASIMRHSRASRIFDSRTSKRGGLRM